MKEEALVSAECSPTCADGSSRETSVVVVVLDSNEVYMLVSLSARKDTQVIVVDPTTGVLCYDEKATFLSEEEALDVITQKLAVNYTRINGRALLGYSSIGSLGVLLVATKLSTTVPNLPGGGCIYTVSECRWIKIPLRNPRLSEEELENIEELMKVDISGKYFFCETVDITRPFPSQMQVQNPDEEFVWNEWLSMPFKRIRLPQHCVTLLQGFAECREFESSCRKKGLVALIARRSRLHPGTRYLARGLNACFSTGNEVECEQLVWIPTAGRVPFNNYIWRRGTAPIFWSAEFKKLTDLKPKIYVAACSRYKGSSEYYQRLAKRYATCMDVNTKENSPFRIVCVNLLGRNEENEEFSLSKHFKESVEEVNLSKKLQQCELHILDFDWHTIIKSRGEEQTIEELWEKVKMFSPEIGIREGQYLPSLPHHLEGALRVKSDQKGVMRFNCADSLDRTNAASYFVSVQVFAEQCRRLGLFLDTSIARLKLGWEKMMDPDKGSYYVERSTGNSTFKHPCSDKDWNRLSMLFDEFKTSTILSPISQLAEVFLLSGDIHATLYTASKATHSGIIRIFSKESQKHELFPNLQNLFTGTQRRVSNMFFDSSRQKQFEMFLGMRLFKYFPSISIHPLQVISRPYSCFLKPVENMIPHYNQSNNLLSFKTKEIASVCTEAADVLELFIYLGEPCCVCQLLLKVMHGADDSNFPEYVDVRTGRNMNDLKLILKKTSIPKCVEGTNLIIPLAGAKKLEDISATAAADTCFYVQETPKISILFDFEESEGRYNFLTRLVAVRFYPAKSGKKLLTLGEVEVLGISLPSRDIFTEHAHGLNLSKLHNKSQRGMKSSELISATDQSANASVSTSSTRSRSAHIYRDCCRDILKRKTINFQDAMRLEIERLRLNLSVAERNRILLNMFIDPASLDPNKLLQDSYLERLCKVADDLALVGQASLEDTVAASVGLENITYCGVDFWNITEIGEICYSNMCDVQARTDPHCEATNKVSSEGIASSVLTCFHCKKNMCKVCCAGKGALLLLCSSSKTSSGFVSQSGQTGGFSTKNSSILDEAICKSCCPEIYLDALILDYVRGLISQRRISRADRAASEALEQVTVVPSYTCEGSKSSDDQPVVKEAVENLLNGEQSLAEFPFASLLHLVQVETAAGRSLRGADLVPSSSNQMDVISLLEEAPKYERFKVPVEIVALRDYNRVVKYCISPCSPKSDGFCVYAFSVLEPRYSHALICSSLTWIDEQHLHPKVLFIQIFASQDPSGYLISHRLHRFHLYPHHLHQVKARRKQGGLRR